MPISIIGKDLYQLPHTSGELVKVGGSYIELPRFQGECLLKPILQMAGKPVPIIEGEKLVTSTPKIKLEQFVTSVRAGFNEFGGIDQVITLLSKPTSNLIIFDYEATKLIPYLQPPLTPEEVAEGCVRPDHVINSIAWYHNSKGGWVTPADVGKGITTGKAFHQYRMMATDALGNKVWTDWELINTSQFGLRIPTQFWNNAIYPVVIAPVGDTFGYTGAGASNFATAVDALYGQVGTPASNGIVDSISASIDISLGSNFKAVLVLESNLNIVANGIGDETADSTDSKHWGVFTYTTKPSVVATTNYCPSYVLGALNAGQYYDTGGTGNQRLVDLSNSYSSPTNPTDGTRSTAKYSIYCTYTPDGGVTVIPSTLALDDTEYIPPIGFGYIPPILAHSLGAQNALTNYGYVPPILALDDIEYSPLIGFGVIPDTLSLNDTEYAPILKWEFIPITLALDDIEYIPVLELAIIPSILALSDIQYAPPIGFGVIPSVLSHIITGQAILINYGYIPSTLSQTITGYIPPMKFGYIPNVLGHTFTLLIPVIDISTGGITLTPGIVQLAISALVPPIGFGLIPGQIDFISSSYSPVLDSKFIPALQELTLSTNILILETKFIPSINQLTLSLQNALLGYGFIPSTKAFILTKYVSWLVGANFPIPIYGRYGEKPEELFTSSINKSGRYGIAPTVEAGSDISKSGRYGSQS